MRVKEVKVGQREQLEPKYKKEDGKEECVFKRVLALPPHMNKRKKGESEEEIPQKALALSLGV